MFRKIILILLFAVPAFAQNFKWEAKDYILLSAYMAGSIIDCGQTIYAIKQNNKEIESNPCMSNKPHPLKVYAFKLISGGLLYYASTLVEQKDRRGILLSANMFQWIVISHNIKLVGMNLNFSISLR